MKIVTDLSVTSRPLRGGAGFNPRDLFATGASGFHWSAAQLAPVFADTAAATPALFGQSVARVNDQGPNGLDTVQASPALRPLLGRAPVAGRRNMLQHTENLTASWWSNLGVTVAETDGGAFALAAQAGGGEKALRSGPNIFPDDPEDALWSVDVQFVNWPLVGLLGVNGAMSSSNQAAASFDLEAGEVAWSASGTAATITPLPDAWYRITMQGGGTFRSRWTLIMLDGAGATSSANQQWIAVGTETVRLRRPQFERAPSPTPYQRVGNALDVTEDGFPSPAFIRFDLSDDVLPTTIPTGGTFDVMIFGRKGSWIERDVEIAAADSLNIGPTRITGSTPGTLLDALGDIVGWVAVDRTLTQTEVTRLVQYHKARGAKGLLVPGGAELVTNSNFDADVSGWQKRYPADVMLWDDGRMRYEPTNVDRGPWQEVTVTPGALYIATAELEYIGGTRFGSLRIVDSSFNNIAPSGFSVSNGDGMIITSTRFIGPSVSTRVYIRNTGSGSNGIMLIDNISVRELRPEEDW